MTAAIEMLMVEHRAIERVLDALIVFAEHVARGDRPPLADLRRFAGWLHGYADAIHHAKEEDLLFEHLVRGGMPRDDGPIGVMLEQHERGRELVGEMREIAVAGHWSDAVAASVIEVARGFTSLLHGHIHAEDTVLYPMSLDRLPAAAWDDLAVAFEAHAAAHADQVAAHDAVASELIARYALASAVQHETEPR